MWIPTLPKISEEIIENNTTALNDCMNSYKYTNPNKRPIGRSLMFDAQVRKTDNKALSQQQVEKLWAEATKKSTCCVPLSWCKNNHLQNT